MYANPEIEQITTLLERMPGAYLLGKIKDHDKTGRTDYAILGLNAAFTALSGVSQRQALGKGGLELFGAEHEDLLRRTDLFEYAAKQSGSFRKPFFSEVDDTHYDVEIFGVGGELFVLRFTETENMSVKGKGVVHDKLLGTVNMLITGMMNLSIDENLYEYIAIKIQSITDAVFVAVNEYVPENRSIVTRAVKGGGTVLDTFMRLSGKKAVGFTSELNDPNAEKILMTGKLSEVPGGLHTLSFGRINKSVSRVLERMFNIGRLFSMGFVWQGKLYGTLTIALKRNATVHTGLMEILSKQVAAVIQKRLVEKNLRESEEMYRNIYLNIQDVYYESTFEGTITEMSPSVEQVTSYKRDELIGRSVYNFYLDRGAREKFVDAIKHSGRLQDYETQMKDKDGSILYVSISAAIVKDAAGTPKIAGILHDVSQRIQMEKALREKNLFLEGVIHQSPLPTFVIDKNGICIMVNRAFRQLHSLPDDFNYNVNLLEVPVNKQLGVDRYMREALNGKIVETPDITFKSPANNKVVSVHSKVFPIFNENKEVVNVVVIQEDVSERKKAESYKHRLEIAQKTAEFKQEFLANMSHEMRTPMNGIINMARFLEDTALDDVQKEYLGIINESSSNLLNIINNVLDLSKIEAGKIVLHPVSFNLRQTGSQMHSLFKALVRDKKLDFEVDYGPNLPDYIIADQVRVQQVLTNYISNAIKYTEKGKIGIRFSLMKKQTDNELLILAEVSDTGCGISKADQDKLFGKFMRLDDDKNKTKAGAGLGLSICKELSNLMGGEAGVESTAGKGSTFWFSFRATTDTKVHEGNPSRAEFKTGDGKLNMNVLVVEDNPLNHKVVRMILEKTGCIIKVAETGQEALKVFEPGKYDLILMDIRLPDINGVETTKKLREMHGRLPPVFALTADAMEGDAEHYLRQGLDDYISKPVNAEKLVEKLHYWKRKVKGN